jgi:hypothetical protein
MEHCVEHAAQVPEGCFSRSHCKKTGTPTNRNARDRSFRNRNPRAVKKPSRFATKTAVSFLPADSLFPSRVRGISFRGLIGLWEIQSVHGLTPEFGGDAEMGASACVLAIGKGFSYFGKTVAHCFALPKRPLGAREGVSAPTGAACD